LLSLTLRELSDELCVGPALEAYAEMRRDKAEAEADVSASAHVPQGKASVADKPILTGHPEYDAWEIAETSTERDFGRGRHATHYYR